MTEIKENKQPSQAIRQTRKSGGSVILTLTDFAQEKEYYAVKKEGNNIVLTNIKLENNKTKKLYYLMMRGTDKQAIDKDGNPLLIFTDEPCKLELQYKAKLVEEEKIDFYMNFINKQ